MWPFNETWKWMKGVTLFPNLPRQCFSKHRGRNTAGWMEVKIPSYLISLLCSNQNLSLYLKAPMANNERKDKKKKKHLVFSPPTTPRRYTEKSPNNTKHGRQTVGHTIRYTLNWAGIQSAQWRSGLISGGCVLESPGGQLQRGRRGEWAHRLKEAQRNPIRRENNMPPRRGNLILTDSTKAWDLSNALHCGFLAQVHVAHIWRSDRDTRSSAHLFGGLQQRGRLCLPRLLHHLVEDPVLVL